MAKIKKAFICQNCGSNSPQWVGKCNACGEWNTYVEEIISVPEKKSFAEKLTDKKTTKPIAIQNVMFEDLPRIKLVDLELDRVLGGGVVRGSVTLIGGEPGIGKSTLMLQLALSVNMKVLYVSGEESASQIKMRADRTGITNDECYVVNDNSLDILFNHFRDLEPEIVVIDSIQTLSSPLLEASAGSVSQIRECTSQLIKYAKESGVPVFIIGHITKDGNIAGPKVLEHMVDTVLQFEGDRNHLFRLVRSIKNRFGSTNELGIYEMQGTGLRQVSNPSEILISTHDQHLSGIAIGAITEGLRPMLIEAQALVSTAVYGTPQRSATGYDLRRLNMLLAVLEKRCGFRLGTQDVFLNMAGGIKVDDPSIDLAVVCAILSSSENMSISGKVCFAGEVGLSGEIRPVARIEQRIQEAEKLGFERIFVSTYNKIPEMKAVKIDIKLVKKVDDVFQDLFG
ncbi:MAG: DNA repair protein RadA/Sms [Salibacteraceae bacterium]|jgi:DNA repair protein RadA/Sms